MRTPSAPVAIRDRRWKQLVQGLVKKCRQSRGVGLAAPQVGINWQLCVVDLPHCLRVGDCTTLLSRGQDISPTDPLRQNFLVLANPLVRPASAELRTGEEGCLSIPDPRNPEIFLSVPVSRPWKISVEFLDHLGRAQTLTVDGFPARCIQHEVDHLRGILITDYANQ